MCIWSQPITNLVVALFGPLRRDLQACAPRVSPSANKPTPSSTRSAAVLAASSPDSTVRKEERVKQILEQRGDRPGMIHIFSAMEACPSYRPWHDKKTGRTFHNDKRGLILRIETTANNVSFFKHHRKVEHRDGTTELKLAPVRKTIYSLFPDLRELPRPRRSSVCAPMGSSRRSLIATSTT